ncbi:hypothetical protein SAURM35S_00193 [Streptomyces aurantiogriseus]
MPTRPHQRTEDAPPDPDVPAPGVSFLALLLALPTLLFALFTWQVATDGPLLDLDGRLSRALVEPDRASDLLADLGNVSVAVPALVLVAWYVARRGRAAGTGRWWLPSVAALVLIVLVPLIVVPLKEWTARPGTPVVPPATGYYPSGRTARSRSAVSSSATCPPTAPTRCRTAGSSSPVWGARASSSRWTTTPTSVCWSSPGSLCDANPFAHPLANGNHFQVISL